MRVSPGRHAFAWLIAHRPVCCAALFAVFCGVSASAQNGNAIAPLAQRQQTTPIGPGTPQSTGVTAPTVINDTPSTDSAVPLAWPEAFGILLDRRGARDATKAPDGWIAVTHELPEMRAHIAYPMEWKVVGGFAPGALVVSNSQETIALTVSLDAREMSPALLEPVTRPRVRQFSDSIRQNLGQVPRFRDAKLQLVAEGQIRLTDRVWLWAEFSGSGIAGPSFDGFRQWSFMTQTGARRAEVNCFVKHQRDIAEPVFETLVQDARAVCGQFLSRLSLEAR